MGTMRRPMLFALSLAAAVATGACSSAEGEWTDTSDEAASGGVAMRFDVATLQCGAQEKCDASSDKCFCTGELAGLMYTSQPHYLSMPTDNFRNKVGDGNKLAAYEDDFNTGYQNGQSGEEAADALWSSLQKRYPGGPPRWIIVNEISKGAWKSGNPAYRKYVVAFMRRLTERWWRLPILCSPFQLPAGYTDGETWAEVSQWARIAVEVQVTGREVKNAGFSVDAAKSVYAQAIASYEKVGVPRGRIFVLDNFANTLDPKDYVDQSVFYGREGVTTDEWIRAIKVRAEAVAALNPAGYVSYAWAGNAMHEDSADRVRAMRAYASMKLP